MSAFSGRHRDNPDKHALAAFVEAVESGQVAVGSYLILENLDRLTREHELDATLFFLTLLKSGVRVVTTDPPMV